MSMEHNRTEQLFQYYGIITALHVTTLNRGILYTRRACFGASIIDRVGFFPFGYL